MSLTPRRVFNNVRMTAYRRDRGLRQADLGELLGYTGRSAVVVVSRWECGKYEPALTTAKMIAASLGVELDDLVTSLRQRAKDRDLLTEYQRDKFIDESLIEYLRRHGRKM